MPIDTRIVFNEHSIGIFDTIIDCIDNPAPRFRIIRVRSLRTTYASLKRKIRLTGKLDNTK